MQNKLRKLIREEIGIHFGVEDLTKIVLERVYLDLLHNIEVEHINDHNFISRTIVRDQSVIDSTNIGIVDSEVSYTETNKERITGNFVPDKTQSNSNGTYRIFIKLIIETDDIDRVKDKVQAVIAHELNHAFVHIQKYQHKPKTPILNTSRRMTSMSIGNIPALREFMQMFYLNLPEEVQARVQEAGTIVKNSKATDREALFIELFNYSFINDARSMFEYKIDDVMKLDVNTLKNFIAAFNKSIKNSNMNDVDMKIITDPTAFFNYWHKFIVENGKKLNRKIMKVIASKIYKESHDANLNEDYYYFYACDSGIFQEYFGYIYGEERI